MAVTKSEVEALRVFGERLREARNLCNLRQNQAALLLGTTPQRLHKLEDAHGVDRVPVSFIRRACEVFDVSSDYLIGLSDDFEQDTESRFFERELGNGMRQFYCNEVSKLIVQSNNMQKQVETALAETAELYTHVESISEAVESFKSLNPDFNNLPGSSKLHFRHDLLKKRRVSARSALTRCKILLSPKTPMEPPISTEATPT